MDDPFADGMVRAQTLARPDVERLARSLKPSHLVDCDLGEADLSRLDLGGWTFMRCNVHRTNFSGAMLGGTIWRSCRGAFANFVGADLSDTRFLSSDFNNCVLRRSLLTGAAFNQCKLTGADFTEARAMDLHLEEVLLINAKLPAFSFRKQPMRKVDLAQADLRKCDFRQVTFEECSLRDANMAGARFEGADLRGADLGGLRLVDAGLFRGATISHAQAVALLAELGLNLA